MVLAWLWIRYQPGSELGRMVPPLAALCFAEA